MFNSIFLIYILFINVIAFAMYGLDKRKAQRHVWRTPEATLIGIAAIGGSVGALCGMNFFHHKTKHLKFRISIPLILIIHIALLYFLFTHAA